ncbi:MAG: GldM family protein [Bacteroidota bacterium]|nr:GldM family protein [Bacteroidota bacterium]MDP4214866.1 GldM family protein [Bacteroidota bacterium]MDP4244728.1 GldM family protein [Bacteroidota bacterium]MDP4255488.1 GldM family protein [Bacteroidota bacterium]MDP4257969.1 GldM family protein [Bacteroidota bacterium]
MSLPKEPRQKMINMMYLVLTALLALNVSAEILNAFKTVNNSLQESNKVVTAKNDLTYKLFAKEQQDQQTKAQADVWAPKAYQVQKLSQSIYDEIEKLKEDLKDESSPTMNNGVKEYNESNLDAATRLFDTKGEGKKLYDNLKQYKAAMLATINPDDAQFASEPLIQSDLRTAKANFAAQLPLDLRVPKSQSGNAPSGDSAKDWTMNYFHMTPTIAAMTILSKFQSDIKNSEAQMVDYFHKKVGEVKVIFDRFQVLAQASSNYVMPGDELSVTAGVGAFSAAAKPTITINGQVQPIGPDGTALFKTKAEGAGEHTVMVHIEYAKPDGSIDKVDKPVKYTVGLPSGASVFLQKMNVLYVGEDNPLTISAGSSGREKMHVSFTGSGEISNTGGDNWMVKPTAPGMAKIVVTTNGKAAEFEMRIKYLPNPTGYVGTHTGGPISSAEFKADGGLIAKLDNSEFLSPFTVVSYKLSAIGGNIPNYQQAPNEGNRWTGRAADLVSRASPGTNIFFDEIRVKGRDGRVRELPSMVFSLK